MGSAQWRLETGETSFNVQLFPVCTGSTLFGWRVRRVAGEKRRTVCGLRRTQSLVVNTC